MRDFNINCNKLSVAPASIANYANSINLLGCIQIVDKPTRLTVSASSISDHIYANQNLLINTYPTCNHLWYKQSFSPSFFGLFWQLTPDKTEKFVIDFKESLSLSECMTSRDLSKLLDLLTSLTNLYFPTKKNKTQYCTLTKHPAPLGLPKTYWIPNLPKRFLKTNSDATFLEYKKCRNKLTHAKKFSTLKFYQSIAF